MQLCRDCSSLTFWEKHFLAKIDIISRVVNVKLMPAAGWLSLA